MPGLSRKRRSIVPLVGDMLFSVLTIPLSFSYLKKWAGDTEMGDIVFALCAMYAAMGAARLFRAFRLRAKSRTAFIAHLTYGAVFWACVALVAAAGPTEDVMSVLALAFWASLLAERVLAIIPSTRRLTPSGTACGTASRWSRRSASATSRPLPRSGGC